MPGVGAIYRYLKGLSVPRKLLKTSGLQSSSKGIAEVLHIVFTELDGRNTHSVQKHHVHILVLSKCKGERESNLNRRYTTLPNGWMTGLAVHLRCCGAALRNGANRSRYLAQLTAQDFAQVGLRQGLVAKLYDLGHLVAGQVLPTMFEQGLFSERRIRFHHDDLDNLAGLVVSCAYRSNLGHARMHRDDLFDLIREDIEAGDHDDVLLPVRDSEVAALVHEPHVAGAQPAVGGENLLGLIRPV